jgi:hypothetical protein
MVAAVLSTLSLEVIGETTTDLMVCNMSFDSSNISITARGKDISEGDTLLLIKTALSNLHKCEVAKMIN